MSTLTLDRSDLTGPELAELLRSGLGPGYNVLAGQRTSRRPLARPRTASPDTVFVGRGSNRLFSAHVTIRGAASGAGGGAGTRLEIVPGGLGWETAVNRLRLVRRIRRCLAAG